MSKRNKAIKRPTIGQLATEAVKTAEAVGDVCGLYEELLREVRVEQGDKYRRFAALEILSAGFSEFWKKYTTANAYDPQLLDANPMMKRAADSLKASRERHLKPVFNAMKSVRQAIEAGMPDELGDLERALSAVIESHAARYPCRNGDLPF